MFGVFGGIAPPWLWYGFLIGIAVLILLDLFVFHRKAHEVDTREALLVSAFWIGLSLAFNGYLAWQFGWKVGGEFLAGYLLEKSLSVDNVFVILLIFGALKIPNQYQHRVLFWGIFGAVVMRAVMILAGAELVRRFDWVLYFFGAILIVSAIKFLRDSDDEADVSNHFAMRALRRVVPVTDKLDGQHLFVRLGGALHATPLFVGLVLIEVSDLVFALDSIPAVFSVTRDPFLAFSSNILAILGLRALYFVIAHWVKSLRYLKPGLAVLLGFVGVKMLVVDLVHIPVSVSLLVISLILLTAGLGSWYQDRQEKRAASR